MSGSCVINVATETKQENKFHFASKQILSY